VVEWAVVLFGRTRGLDLDHGQLSTSYESLPEARCLTAAHSAREYPHHGLRTLCLVHHVAQKVRSMVVLPQGPGAHRLATWGLEAGPEVGSRWPRGWVGHSSRYPSGGIRRQNWMVFGRGRVEICRVDTCCCPDTGWRT